MTSDDNEPDAAPVPVRDERGRLLPGHHQGRPRGTGELAQQQRVIAPERDAILATLIATAKAGGTSAAVRAAEVLLSRLAAAPKPRAELVDIPAMRAATTLQGKVHAVLDALAQGQVSAEAARAVLQTIDTAARVKTYSELEKRLLAVEAVAGLARPAAAMEEGSDLL